MPTSAVRNSWLTSETNVGADGPAVGLDRIDGALPQRLEFLVDALELVGMEVPGDRRADHLLGRGAEQSRHAGVDVDDVRVDSGARDA